MSRQIILDTETTGLSPEKGHRIIEIAGIEMLNRCLTNNHFHYYLNPDRTIERGAQEIHGITDEFLQDKPRFPEVIEQFLQFIQGAELIIHNAAFDVGFLNHELQLAGSQYRSITDYCSIIDTLLIARRKHPGQHNNLDALCKRYRVDNSNRDLHGALIDANLLARVYLAMTGGQTKLFAETDEQTILNDIQTIHGKLTTKKRSLPVITASAEEMIAHEAFMQMIRDKSAASVEKLEKKEEKL